MLVFDHTRPQFKVKCTNTESFLSHHLTDLGLSIHSLNLGNGLNKNLSNGLNKNLGNGLNKNQREYSKENKLTADVIENLEKDDMDFSETIVVFNKVDLVDISNEIQVKNSSLDVALNIEDSKSTNNTNRQEYDDNVNVSSVNDNNSVNKYAEHLPLCDSSSRGDANVEFVETVCDDTNQDSDMFGESHSEDLALPSRQSERKEELVR